MSDTIQPPKPLRYIRIVRGYGEVEIMPWSARPGDIIEYQNGQREIIQAQTWHPVKSGDDDAEVTN